MIDTTNTDTLRKYRILQVTYKELFTSEEEKQERLQNFIAASKVIDAHNEGPNGRYFQLEHNRMSLLVITKFTNINNKFVTVYYIY